MKTHYDDEDQRVLHDAINRRVTELNEFLQAAHRAGDVIQGAAMLWATVDGPRLDLDIHSFKNAFWKK